MKKLEANMDTSTDVLQLIEESYKTFSKGQRYIANYICSNYDKAVDMTAARLGKIVGVSESTVVRFATELGFKGYPQFQKAVGRACEAEIELCTENFAGIRTFIQKVRILYLPSLIMIFRI